MHGEIKIESVRPYGNGFQIANEKKNSGNERQVGAREEMKEAICREEDRLERGEGGAMND